MASMKDVAAACHVSVATVSKALNNHSDISEETKLHIRKTAKDMGYFPNSVARALKTNKTFNIGVLFVEEAHSGLTHDYFSNVLDSFKQTAEKAGYDITFLNCNRHRKNRMSYLNHSLYRKFDGVVVACVNFDDPEVAELVESNIPVVTIDRCFENRCSVLSDNYQGEYELLRYILEMGHRKIAYIHGADSAVTQQRVNCFKNTMNQMGIKIPDEYLLEAGYRDVDKTGLMTQKLLELQDRPTCILFPDDYAAIGGVNAIRAAGLSIPEDISVAGYDGIPIIRMFRPRLTTVEQDTRKIGNMAAYKLIELIEKPGQAKVETIIVNGRVSKGQTIKNVNNGIYITNCDN